MTSSLIDYENALKRLVENKPQRVLRGTQITNDSVSLEAGRGKGSIKKSRSVFAALIVEIDKEALVQAKSESQIQSQTEILKEIRLDNVKMSAKNYRLAWEAGLSREVSLVLEVYALKKQLVELTGGNVLPIRSQMPKG